MDFLYSESIMAFLAEARKKALRILKEEMGLRVGTRRFFYKNYSYPLTILLFEDETKLGYFDPNYYEIGLNKELQDIDNVLRHELAHYMCWIVHGQVQAHGAHYRAICKQYGWGKEVYEAVRTIPKTKRKHSAIATKIHKLLSLATSSNPYEAQAATLKANELLVKHNISYVDQGDEMRVKRLITQKRATTKLQALATILRTFMVYPVLSRGRDSIALEVFGTRENIEAAEYVALFLNHELEQLWKKSGLSGATTKNSFFRGIAEGYTTQAKVSEKALIKIENSISMAYPHLSTKKVRFSHCEKGSAKGKEVGRSLSIAQYEQRRLK